MFFQEKTLKTHQQEDKKEREREEENQLMALLSRIDQFEKKEKQFLQVSFYKKVRKIFWRIRNWKFKNFRGDEQK